MIKLDLSDNNLGGWTDKTGMQELANALSASSVQELNISNNDIRSEDAAIIAEGLKTMR